MRKRNEKKKLTLNKMTVADIGMIDLASVRAGILPTFHHSPTEQPECKDELSNSVSVGQVGCDLTDIGIIKM